MPGRERSPEDRIDGKFVQVKMPQPWYDEISEEARLTAVSRADILRGNYLFKVWMRRRAAEGFMLTQVDENGSIISIPLSLLVDQVPENHKLQ